MLDTIRAFIDVASAGSFTAVARRSAVAVSSVARKIDALEAELGVKLFARSSRSLVLTDAGVEFLARARHIVAEMDEAKRSLTELNAEPAGRLTVTVPAAFGRHHVVPALASFLELYPQIDVELHASDQRVDLLTQRVDVAIRIGVLPDSDLVATRLAGHTRLACASPEYLARHGRPQTPEELVRFNCLSFASTPLPPGWWCFAGINRDAALPVQGTLKSDDTETLLAAALAGVGIVHLANWLVSEPVRAGQLVSLFPDWPAAPDLSRAAIHAVRMPGRSHTTRAQLFIAHLKSYFGDPPYWERG